MRGWLEDHDLGYVLGVGCHREVTTACGRFRVDALAGMVPDHAWETYSAADGSKGPRLYDWALIDTVDIAEKTGRARQVLVRRSHDDNQELAFFITYSPRPVTLGTLVTVAGRRWAVEECFQSGKNEVGLDQYQVRLYGAWYRHMTLAMLAQAWLAVTAAKSHEKQHPPPPQKRTTTAIGYYRGPDSLPIDLPPEIDRNAMIPLTLNEIHHLHAIFHPADHLREFALRWSNWRRRHQASARYWHYKRRILAAQALAGVIRTTPPPLELPY